MAFKNIVHDVAETIAAKAATIAEQTAPDYVPPREPLTIAAKQKFVRAKANLEMSDRKLEEFAKFFQTTHNMVSAYHIPNLDIATLSNAIKTLRSDLKQQIKYINDELK